jgi:hypothetical protein
MEKDYNYKKQLILNYLKLCYELTTSSLEDVDVRTITKDFIKKKAANDHLDVRNLVENMGRSTNNIRRRFQIDFLFIDKELEQEIIDSGSSTLPESQYRYNLSGILKIYDQFTDKRITKQGLNLHKQAGSDGYVKLPTLQLKGEHTTVLEKDVITYIYTETGVKLEPEQIRHLAYKKPLPPVKDEGED